MHAIGEIMQTHWPDIICLQVGVACCRGALAVPLAACSISVSSEVASGSRPHLIVPQR